jgi:antitoxin ParD1/3/4
MSQRYACFWSPAAADFQCWQKLAIIGIQTTQREVFMATMNVSLPEPMKDWVETQSRTGRYANTSDYVRDLIRKDQDRAEKIARMQQLVKEGLDSGEGSRTMDQLREDALTNPPTEPSPPAASA